MARQTFTIELDDADAALISRVAESRGLDVSAYLNTYAVAAARENAEADEAMRLAGREAIREAAEGLLLTPEKAREEALAILAARRAEREQQRESRAA